MSKPLRIAFVALAAMFALGFALVPAFVVIGAEIEALRWEKPWWLLGLVVLPGVLWASTVGEDARIPRLRVGTVASARMVSGGLRRRLRDVPGVLRTVAIALIVLALARPQTIAAAEMDERSGIDIMMVLDLSGSMAAADLKPTRLAAAKTVVQEFIERRQDDRIGAVVFGSDAFLLSPPTFDHVRLGQLVGRMELGAITGDATAIGDGLATALARLRRSQASSKVIVLLTDGENNTGSMNPTYAAELAKQIGVRIYTVQMGNGDEVEIQTDTDSLGRPVYQRARIPVNPALLKQIAQTTGGEAWIATQTDELRSSMHAILDHLTKTKFEAASGDVVERFPFALIPGVALVLIEAVLRAALLRRFP